MPPMTGGKFAGPVNSGDRHDIAHMFHIAGTGGCSFSDADERRRRRKMLNRESARRSRMRKQRLLEDLKSQVSRLHEANLKLIDMLKAISHNQQQVVQENLQLKEAASDLCKLVQKFILDDPSQIRRHHEDAACSNLTVGDEFSSQSFVTSIDFS